MLRFANFRKISVDLSNMVDGPGSTSSTKHSYRCSWMIKVEEEAETDDEDPNIGDDSNDMQLFVAL
jgi:hypothetical protein